MKSLDTLAGRLAYARTLRGLSQQALAKLAGVAQSTIGNIEAGSRAEPNKLTVIARALSFNAAWLLSREGPEEASNVEPGPERRGKVPLLSWIQAGEWSSVNIEPGDAQEWIDTTVPIHSHTYALRVKGPSMTAPSGEPTFPEGSVIVVEPDSIAPREEMVGRFVIVKRGTESEATFKQLVRDGDRFFLLPLNPQWQSIELRDDDVFCGVVREKITRFF